MLEVDEDVDTARLPGLNQAGRVTSIGSNQKNCLRVAGLGMQNTAWGVQIGVQLRQKKHKSY